MKIRMSIYLNGLRKQMNREVIVNDNLSLQRFSEYVIVSMNGNCKHLFQLIKNEEYGYLGPKCVVKDNYEEEMMNDLTLEDIGVEENDELMVNYDFRSDWEFIINVISVEEGYNEKEFEVISGTGQGILEDSYGVNNLKQILSLDINSQYTDFLSRRIKGLKEYLNKDFNISTINSEIEEFFEKYYERNKPKNYIMNVSLSGFEKEIKRKIAVDSSVDLDIFCECIIISTMGDLSHSYGIKINKEYLDDEEVKEQDLNYLELKEKQRLKVVYDFGDNWVFNVTVSKIVDDYGTKRCQVLSGKGYGIIDDCGGAWGLRKIFNYEDSDWGKYDIEEFDIDKINSLIDLRF